MAGIESHRTPAVKPLVMVGVDTGERQDAAVGSPATDPLSRRACVWQPGGSFLAGGWGARRSGCPRRRCRTDPVQLLAGPAELVERLVLVDLLGDQDSDRGADQPAGRQRPGQLVGGPAYRSRTLVCAATTVAGVHTAGGEHARSWPHRFTTAHDVTALIVNDRRDELAEVGPRAVRMAHGV